MKRVIILLLAALGCASCAPWKNTIKSEGGSQQAILNAIIDFSNTCYLFKEDQVFSVNIQKSDDIISVSILGGDDNKIFPMPDIQVGAYAQPYFPTMFFVQKGKLFYWNDPEQKITQELLDVLQEYDHIDPFNWEKVQGFIPYKIDDRKKAADYYFCANDLSNYRKVVTWIAMGWYDPPKLKCRK